MSKGSDAEAILAIGHLVTGVEKQLTITVPGYIQEVKFGDALDLKGVTATKGPYLTTLAGISNMPRETFVAAISFPQ